MCHLTRVLWDRPFGSTTIQHQPRLFPALNRVNFTQTTTVFDAHTPNALRPLPLEKSGLDLTGPRLDQNKTSNVQAGPVYEMVQIPDQKELTSPLTLLSVKNAM